MERRIRPDINIRREGANIGSAVLLAAREIGLALVPPECTPSTSPMLRACGIQPAWKGNNAYSPFMAIDIFPRFERRVEVIDADPFAGFI
jgi:hypothetical protein